MGAVASFLLKLVQDSLGGAEEWCVDIRASLVESLDRPFWRRPKGASPPNCDCMQLFSRSAAAWLSRGRSWAHSGAVRACPAPPLWGTLHAASDIVNPVEQPGSLRGQLDSNGYGSAELGYPPQLPQRPLPTHTPTSCIRRIWSSSQRSGEELACQEALQVDEGGVIGISGVQTDLLVGKEFAPVVSEQPAWVGEGLGNFCGTEADGLKMQLPTGTEESCIRAVVASQVSDESEFMSDLCLQKHYSGVPASSYQRETGSSHLVRCK